MRNVADVSSNLTKRDLTLMFKSTIKICLPEWDTVTPLMKKLDFHASNNYVSITELLFRWIEVR